MINQIKNIFADVPENLPEELVESFLDRPGFKLERIVSQGHASPPGFWYDQDRDEWVMLVSGNAEIMFEGESEPRTFSPGDWVMIPARCRHRVLWTDPENDTVWLALHFNGEGGGK